MSGKPGRSGRKPAEPQGPPELKTGITDPLAYLLAVMDDPTKTPGLRVRAAVAAAQYLHVKKGDGGIKDSKKDAARAVSKGKFTPAAAPPRLVVHNK